MKMISLQISTANKIRIAAALSAIVCFFRRLIGQETVGIFHRGGLTWWLDLREGIDFSIFLLGHFEPATIRLYQRILRNRKQPVILDIGANVGAHTLHLARLAAPLNGRVIAFEPTVWAFDKLQHNLSLNPALSPTVHLHHAMLVSHADAPADLRFFSGWPLSNPEKSLHLVHRGQSREAGDARKIMLDDFVRENILTRVDFMKIDVDGHEPEVIEGAWQTLELFKPDMLLEWAPYLFQDRPGSMLRIMERLRSMGYVIYLADRFRRTSIDQLDGLTPAGGSLNLYLTAESLTDK